MSKKFFRGAVLETNAEDLKKGIARLSFASELPVLRRDKEGKYYEILSHGRGDVNLHRLNTEGMVFEDHDERIQIGDVVPGSAKVEADKKTRATIQVDDEHWKARMAADAAVIPISVGYTRLSVVKRSRAGDGIEKRYYSFQPYEISLLTKAPADDTVGFGRAKQKRRCADCSGHGRCSCREDDDAKADKNCEDCDGSGDCAGCDGDGYIQTARELPAVDSLSKLDAEQLNEQLTKKQRDDMRILLKADPADGGDNKTAIVEADIRKDERAKAAKDTSDACKARVKEIGVVIAKHTEKHGERVAKVGDKEVKLRDRFNEIAQEAIEKDWSIDAFKTRCLEEISGAGPEKVDIREHVPAEDLAQFSMVRAIQQAWNNRRKGGEPKPDEKSVEGGIIKEHAKRCSEAEGGPGFETSGFIVPFECQMGNHTMSRRDMVAEYKRMVNRYGRDMQATNFGAGGAAVPAFWLLPVIELLRNKTVLNRVGMRTMAGLTGNVILPRLEAPSTAYSLAEIQAGTASQQTLGQLTATPHRVFNEVDYSKQLVFQSSPDIETLIKDDMFTVLGLKRDILGLNGQGANSEPLGIFNTPGIGAITFGATPTYAKMVAFETLIRSQNVTGKLSYASTSATKGSLKTVAEALTGATTIGGAQNAIWKSIGGDGEDDGVVNGCQAIDSQQIPNNQVLAGVFNHFVECMWSGLDIVVDYYTKASNAEVRVVMNLWLDFLCRHPQAFCASTDAGNQ